MSRASSRRPAFINQRGLSGTTKRLIPKSADGSVSEANIQRQPVVMFQDASPSRWISRFTK